MGTPDNPSEYVGEAAKASELDQLRSMVDASRAQTDELAAKLVEQQQINAQLRQSLADTTSYVLTLCRVIQRTIG